MPHNPEPTSDHPQPAEALKTFIRTTIPQMLIPEQDMERITAGFERLSLNRHEHLLKPGRISSYAFVVSGFLRVYLYSPEGEEITTNFYGPNRIVFDAASFFSNIPSAEHIQAITDCTLLVTSFDQLNVLFHEVPAFREFGRAVLVREFILHKQRTLSMINRQAEERYVELMQHHKDIFQVAQLRHIASYLGITDTSLSRIRREMTKK